MTAPELAGIAPAERETLAAYPSSVPVMSGERIAGMVPMTSATPYGVRVAELAARVDLAPSCRARADMVRDHAERFGLGAEPAPVPTYVCQRAAWDAHAASEYPRPMLADGADMAALWPTLAPTVWHLVAGATILGRPSDCCAGMTPAAARDAVVILARRLAEPYA